MGYAFSQSYPFRDKYIALKIKVKALEGNILISDWFSAADFIHFHMDLTSDGPTDATNKAQNVMFEPLGEESLLSIFSSQFFEFRIMRLV